MNRPTLVILSCSALVASTARAELNPQQLRHIEPQVVAAIEAGECAGAVVAVGASDGVAYLRSFGHRQVEPQRLPMETSTVFDLASVTKPVATATSVMVLFERGALRLSDPVARRLPEVAGEVAKTVTLEHLLTHYAGYIPDNPLDDYRHGVDEAWRRLFALEPQHAPGTRFQYSDVNFELLGKVVERAGGQPLDAFARETIFAPLGMGETTFLPSPALAARAAATEPREGKMLVGEVHDPRAALLGGVAGHAGLFGTAEDLARYAVAMLRGGAPVLRPATLRLMTTPQGQPGARRCLGWDSRSGYSTNRGELFSDRAYGHGGFTGNAFWIDPGLDLFVVFLSNRLHPDGVGNVNDLAGRIGTIAAAAVE